MSSHSARRRRSRRRRSPIARCLFLAAAVAMFVLAVVGASYHLDRAARVSQPGPRTEARESESGARLPIAASSAGRRPVYPFSVIEGGAASAEELKEAIEKDPVVAAHFAGFDLRNTRTVRIDRPKLTHVAYRKQDEVFWTRKRIVIPAGETVLTDGVRMARTRCGNRLADTPGPVAADEPPVEVMDTPIAADKPPVEGMDTPVAADEDSAPSPRTAREVSREASSFVDSPGAHVGSDPHFPGPHPTEERPIGVRVNCPSDHDPPADPGACIPDDPSAETPDDEGVKKRRTIPEPGASLLMVVAAGWFVTRRIARRTQ